MQLCLDQLLRRQKFFFKLDISLYAHLTNFIQKNSWLEKEFNMEARKMLFLVKALFWLMQEVFSCLIKLLQYQYCTLKIVTLTSTSTSTSSQSQKQEAIPNKDYGAS